MSTRYVWGRYRVSRFYDNGGGYDAFVGGGIILHTGKGYSSESGSNESLYYAVYSEYSDLGPSSGRIRVSNLQTSGEVTPNAPIMLPSSGVLIFASSPITNSTISASICYVINNSVTFSAARDTSYYDMWKFTSVNGSMTVTGYNWYSSSQKGEYISDVSGTSQSSYPTDGVSGSYWYTYKGSDNIDPTAVGYNKTTPKGGESITINVTPKSNTYGGTITYKYEVQLSGGTWTNIGSTTSTAKSYVIPKGTTTFRARVVASDNMGFTSTDYVTGNQIAVVNNVAPVISGSNQNLGVFTYNPPVISYVVTDENNDTVTVTVQLDSSTLESRTVTLGQTYTVPINWWDIGTGTHTVTITANDGQGGTATRTYTFTKNSVGQISFNRLHKKTNTGYQTTYIESDSDSIITSNGQILSERLSNIADKLSVSINTSPAEMVLRHRLHIKLTSEYTIDYLEMYSTNIKVGTRSLEEVLVQLETAVGISNGGTVPSDLNFERWRMKNSSGTYDIIYLEGISEHVIRPCGKTVEESLQAIEAKI